jgi:hypothetical protein
MTQYQDAATSDMCSCIATKRDESTASMALEWCCCSARLARWPASQILPKTTLCVVPVRLFVPRPMTRLEGRSNPTIVARSQPGAEDYHCNEQGRLLTVGMEEYTMVLIPVTWSYRPHALRRPQLQRLLQSRFRLVNKGGANRCRRAVTPSQ